MKKLQSFAVASVVGVGSMEAGALGLANVVHGRRTEQPLRVGFDRVEYLVGPNVAFFARPIERMDFARFSEGPELRAVLYAALYLALDGGSHKAALAIGLPVEVLQDAEQAAQTERALAKWLVGKHRFTVNGTEAKLDVVNIRAKLAQPVATWFDWGLDLEGHWAKGAAAARAPVLIIDQGFNTLDLVVVEGGQISTRYTSGETLGMRRAAEMAAANVNRRHGVDMSLHEADGLVRMVLAGKKGHVYVLGEATDATADVKQAINSLSADVARFVERNVGKGRKFRILLTGGGALALSGRLLAQFPHAEVVAEPVLANARGLAKLAQRPGFLLKDEGGGMKDEVRRIGVDPGFGGTKVAEVVETADSENSTDRSGGAA